MARRSASNARISAITSPVSPPTFWQKAWKSSKYALYSVLRITSTFISSSSSAAKQSPKYGLGESRRVSQQ